jgi:acyl-CoA reductase-like NAD-dependent aldehyde dehydrogenase
MVNKRSAEEGDNWIDNMVVKGTGQKVSVLNPATGKAIEDIYYASSQQVDQAVKSSHEAFLKWSKRTVKDRVQFLIRYHQLVIKNKDKLADLIVLEHGKTKEEALAEVAKGNETVEFALSLPQLILGSTLEVSRGVTCQNSRKPHGVVVSIVPFNFPFMVPHWTLPIAIVCGNTLIVKPSEKVPLTMKFAMDLLNEAGLPDGVVNLVHGQVDVVNQLCDHKLVKAVTFVGTSHVAKLLNDRCRLLNKRVLALGYDFD